ncbi:hypothetical protein ACIBEK_06640 [Nocardia fusca]|uniref:hypothetical protein n=1 Tax=Nocardia fusca TaxID=941183 RepID=UPI0037BB468A
MLAYLDDMAERLDLEKNYRFDTTVNSATYSDDDHSWTVTTEDGRQSTAKYVVNCVRIQSGTLVPDVSGIERFAGQTLHTAAWPREPIDPRGKRSAVIGTGASGVLVNEEITDAIHDNYVAELAEFRRRVRHSPGSAPFPFSGRRVFDHTPEEREWGAAADGGCLRAGSRAA